MLAAHGWLLSPIHPTWSIALVAAAAALLVAAVAVQVATLLEVTWGLAAAESASRHFARPLSARVSGSPGGWNLAVTGPPHETVMVLADGLDPVLVVLDEHGRGTVARLPLDPGTDSVRVLPVAVDREEVAGVPWPSPTPALPTSTPTAATATATPTSPPAGRTPTQPHPAAAAPPPTSTPGPRPPRGSARGAPPVLHLVTDGGPRLALTFDGAASDNGTAELLDLLQELHLHVTLFVTGEFIDRHPALVRRALLEGHEVGNHTYSHPHLTSYATDHRHRLLEHVTRERLQDELRRCEEAFVRATGRPMAPLWRAPYGEENASLRGWAMELGYLHVRWSSLGGASLDSLDWVDDEHSALYRDSERIISRLLSFPRLEGGIVLMHLSSDRELPPWRELPRFVARLQARGLSTVTVSELLQASPTWRPWLERARARHGRLSGGTPQPRAGGARP